MPPGWWRGSTIRRRRLLISARIARLVSCCCARRSLAAIWYWRHTNSGRCGRFEKHTACRRRIPEVHTGALFASTVGAVLQARLPCVGLTVISMSRPARARTASAARSKIPIACRGASRPDRLRAPAKPSRLQRETQLLSNRRWKDRRRSLSVDQCAQRRI